MRIRNLQYGVDESESESESQRPKTLLHVQTGNMKDSLIKQESNLQKHTILACKNYIIADLSFHLNLSF